MSTWQEALAVFAERATVELSWMVVGSTATALHGVEITPGDVDILVHPDTSDADFRTVASRLMPYAASGPAEGDIEGFFSTSAEPLIYDGAWTFGRWHVNGCRLEVARIRDAVEPWLLLETQGAAVWETTEHLAWRTTTLPVVPLEVQLATSLTRGLNDRSRLISQALTRRPRNEDILIRAHAARGLERAGGS